MSTDVNLETLSQLAQIQIEPTESAQLQAEINAIFEMIDAALGHEDTESIEPLAHPLNQTQPRRADMPSETNQRDQFQQIAPKTEDGLYCVPPFMTTE